MSERSNFEQFGSLRALQYSASDRPIVRIVRIQQYAIDNGITIPFLRAYTQVRGRFRTAEVLVHDVHQKRHIFRVFYIRNPHAYVYSSISTQVFEGDIFIFRSSRRRGYLIDVKHGDEVLTRIAVDRFVADFGRPDYSPPTRMLSSNHQAEADHRYEVSMRPLSLAL